MHSPAQSAPVSKKKLWTGRIISALPVLLLLFSGTIKLIGPPAVLDGFTRLGYPASLAIPIAVLELVCTIVYIIPRTSVFGAILLTAFLGGATATHVRVGEPFVGPVIVGILVWIGIFLREGRLRALVPLRG